MAKSKKSKTVYEFDNLKFNFAGKYDSYLFTCSEKLSPVSFKELSEISQKLADRFDTNPPITITEMHDRKFISLWVKGCDRFKRLTSKNKGAMFSMSLALKTRNGGDGEVYVNAFCKKLTQTAEPFNSESLHEDLDLE